MRTALIVIDVQESFRARATLDGRELNPDIADRVDRLVDAARATGDLVVWVLHTEPGTGGVFDPASGHVRPDRPARAARRRAGDHQDLAQRLHHHESAAAPHRARRRRGGDLRHPHRAVLRDDRPGRPRPRLPTSFVTDATATTPLPHWTARPGRPIAEVLADPRTLSADEIVRAHRVRAGRPVRHHPDHSDELWTGAGPWRADRIMTRVVFLLVPRLHLLDLAGPAQVFSTADDLGYGYELRYVAERRRITAAQGVPLRRELEWPALGPDDLIVVPGWRSPRLSPAPPHRARDAAAGWSTTTRRAARWPACAPAPTRSAGPGCSTAGGAPPTTTCRRARRAVPGGHGRARRPVRRRRPGDHLRRDRQRDRPRAAPGRGRHGPGAAARVAREMVVYARRNGDELQDSAMLRHRGHLSDARAPGAGRRSTPGTPSRCRWPISPAGAGSASAP